MLRRIRSLVSNFNFLESYDDILSKEECHKMIDDFENSDMEKHYGAVGGSIAKKEAETLSCELSNGVFSNFNKPVVDSLSKVLPLYKNKYDFMSKLFHWRWDDVYNIQKYGDGDGYYTLHCEQGPITSSRILVWMIFLNDAECGTEFPYQNKTMDAKTGRVVLWPAAWTHPHKGVTPNRGLKYIATGWYSYCDPK